MCAAQGSGIPPPSPSPSPGDSTDAPPPPPNHASRFVFERAGRVRVKVANPEAGDIILPSACGAAMGLDPAMDAAEMCTAMSWSSPAGVQACSEGNIVQALRFAWDDWSSAALSLPTKSASSPEAAILEAFAVACSLASVHLMQAGLPHATLQVAHIVEAASNRVSIAAKHSVAPSLMLVSCNATLALAAIGGGGGLRQWLQPIRSSLSQLPPQPSPSPSSPSASIAVACAYSVQGALQALQRSFAKAAASLDRALACMRAATAQIDVNLLSAPQSDTRLADLMRVREVVHDSAVVTWNMCVVFRVEGVEEQQQQHQQQQCYEYALSECVKFTLAAGSDPGRPIIQLMGGAASALRLHRCGACACCATPPR